MAETEVVVASGFAVAERAAASRALLASARRARWEARAQCARSRRAREALLATLRTFDVLQRELNEMVDAGARTTADGAVRSASAGVVRVPRPLPPDVRPAPTVLSRRQREVLELVASGASTESIARELWLAPATVRNHIARSLRALGAHTRIEAIVRARELGEI